jgi:TatD DNase family protein
MDRLLIETDSPYLAPQGFRGKRNEPAYVRTVAEKIASLHACTLNEVATQTARNADKVFKLKRGPLI